ncbi:MAG: O-antigen ligase family protein [Vulcanimicrobiota bacterium]
MKAALASSFLAFALLPLIFDMRCADPITEPKLACWLLAAGLAATSPHRPWSLAERFLGGWFMWAILSSLVNGIQTAWLDLLTIGAGVLWARAPAPRRHLFMGLAFGLTVAYAWVQHMGLDPFEWSHPHLSVVRGIAGLGNPNYLSMYLACLSPWAWTRLYPRGPLGWLAALLSLTVLFLTATRGSILVLICMLVIATLYGRLRDRRFWGVTWLLLALSWGWSNHLSSQQTYGLAGQMQSLKKGSDQSVIARGLLWSVAWKASLQHPLFGLGFGRFGEAYLLDRPAGEPETMIKLSRRPEDPHNEPLKILSENGWMGLVLWSGWIGLGLLQRLKKPGPETAGLMILLANSLSNCFVVAVWPLLVTWTLPETPPSSRRGHPVGLLALLLCLLLAAPGWLLQHRFWWDDEWSARARHDPEHRLQYLEMRLLSLNRADWFCPPWEATGLAVRQCAGWSELGQLTQNPMAWGQAEAAARRKLALEPENSFSWIGLAQVFAMTGRWAEEVSCLQEAQRRDSSNPNTLFMLARAQYNAGLVSEALTNLDRSLEIYSKSSQVYRFRAQIMIDQGMVWEGYWDWFRSEQFRWSE